MKKNTRVKITGRSGDNYASCYNGMIGITLNESKSPCLRVAINGVMENQHYFSEEYLTPVEPSISTLCVGDVLVDGNGDEHRVLVMQGDSFLRSHVGNLDHAGDWYTKDQASLFGWEVKEDNLIRWKKWDTGETGTWDDDKEEIAYFGSGWTHPYPFETGTKEPGETGTKEPGETGTEDTKKEILDEFADKYQGFEFADGATINANEFKNLKNFISKTIDHVRNKEREKCERFYDDVLELLEEDNEN